MKKRNTVHYIVLAVVTVILVTPVLVTLVYSFTESWIHLKPSGFPSMKYWNRLLFETPEFWQAIGRSLFISVFPIFISGICMILAMYAAVLYFPRLDAILQAISMIPYTLRGVVLAISVLSLYAGKGTIFSNRYVMLVCVYCVVILPFVYRGIRNNLYAINVRQLIEAAELLGASGIYTFFRIIVPNMLSGILVSALMALGSIFTDYAVIKIIAGSRYITAQHVVYEAQRALPGPLTSTMVFTMFTFTLLIAIVTYGLQARNNARQKKKLEVEE